MKKIRYSLLKNTKKFIESAKKEVILSGAFGSGKSVALCQKLLLLSLKYPNNRGYLGRKTLQSLKSTTLKTLLDGDGGLPPVLPKAYILSHNKTDRVITLKNGSEIYYGPIEINILKSMNIGWFAVDEMSEISENEWLVGVGRLRLAGIPVTQAFGATNPQNQGHWIFNRYIEEADDYGNILRFKNTDRSLFITSKTTDNHFLSKDYIETQEKTLFGHLYKRFFLGLWVSSGKLVYENFSPKIHVIDKFKIPEKWLRFRVVDFGYIKPFVCQWYAIAGKDAKDYNLEENDLVMYREYYFTRRIISLHAEAILKYSKNPDGSDEKIIATVADWDSGDRGELEAKGIKTIKANKDITSGLQKVSEYLGNDDPTSGAIVRPKIYFFRNCNVEFDPKIRISPDTGERTNDPIGAIEEFQSYSWKINKSGQLTSEPEDRYNHAMDCVRYAVQFVTGNSTWKSIGFLHL